MDRAEIQSCPPSLSPRLSHPERSRTRAPELNEGSLKHKQALSENTWQSRKGYVTNLPNSDPEAFISAYHRLHNIEESFAHVQVRPENSLHLPHSWEVLEPLAGLARLVAVGRLVGLGGGVGVAGLVGPC